MFVYVLPLPSRLPQIRFLWTLTIDSGAKGVLMQAVPTVLRVGARYDGVVTVVRYTLKFFNNLAVDEENRVPLRPVLPCVLAALRAHGGDEEAARSAMSTLLGLSCAEANGALLCDVIQDMTNVMEQQMEAKDVSGRCVGLRLRCGVCVSVCVVLSV